MSSKMWRWTLIYASALSAVAFCSVRPVKAETNAVIMKKAVEEYRQGNFSDAAGHFYATLTSEFSNATVHYYMASCYVHLNDTESAAREFRIAYALAPNSDIGYYSNIALKYFHFNSDGNVIIPKGNGSANSSTATAASASSKTNTSMSSGVSTSTTSSQGIWKASDLPPSRRRPSTTDVKERDKQTLNLPDDIKSVLNNLKNEYDNKKQVSVGRASSSPAATTSPPTAATTSVNPAASTNPVDVSGPPAASTMPSSSTTATTSASSTALPSPTASISPTTIAAPEQANDPTSVKPPATPPAKFYPPFQP